MKIVSALRLRDLSIVGNRPQTCTSELLENSLKGPDHCLPMTDFKYLTFLECLQFKLSLSLHIYLLI